jgi:tetratricopeptide (TPR) repeat protein
MQRHDTLAARCSAFPIALFVACLVLPRVGLSQGDQSLPWEAQVQSAMEAGMWDAAIDLLDPVLEDAPDQLRPRLLRAICYREKAKVTYEEVRAGYYLDPSELRAMWHAAQSESRGETWQLDVGRDYDVTRAMFDFEHILARDSSYDRALHEYAILWHDHDLFDRAISLGEEQLAFRPDLPEAHEELIETYRHFLAWTPSARALRWLQERATPYAMYFIGEIHRREGRLERADSLFEAMLADPAAIPPQPVLLSRARIRIAQERYRAAHAFIEDALQFDRPVEARLLYRDFFYVMDEDEFAEARTLQTVAQYADFYERLWARRNPTPASRINWRLVEHYRRLVTAEREYAYFGARPGFSGYSGPTTGNDGNSDTSGLIGTQVTFPPLYRETHGFNDKGVIYIRHGEPDERVVTQPRPDIDLNESWRYAAEDVEFHFFISQSSGTAYSWRLVSYLGNCYMADDRRHWGGFYAQIAPRMQMADPLDGARRNDPCGQGSTPRSEVDLFQGMDKLSTAGQEAITEGLTTDRHTWTTRDVESFDYPFDVVTFRGTGGQTDVSAYFALPVGWFSEAVPSQVLPVDVGLALHDTTWTPVAASTSVREYEAATDPTRAAFEELHVSVAPDSYRVSLHSELIGSSMLGGYQFWRRIPDYSRQESMMSDVLLAYDIRPKAGHVPSTRSSLQFIANPFHRAAIDQPVHVYFELYNLALDENDVARYEVTYRIEPVEEGGLLGFLGRDEPALSVSAGFEDDTPSPIVFSQIDVRELDAGTYTLVVRVTDATSGEAFERRLALELLAPES